MRGTGAKSSTKRQSVETLLTEMAIADEQSSEKTSRHAETDTDKTICQREEGKSWPAKRSSPATSQFVRCARSVSTKNTRQSGSLTRGHISNPSTQHYATGSLSHEHISFFCVSNCDNHYCLIGKSSNVLHINGSSRIKISRMSSRKKATNRPSIAALRTFSRADRT